MTQREWIDFYRAYVKHDLHTTLFWLWVAAMFVLWFSVLMTGVDPEPTTEQIKSGKLPAENHMALGFGATASLILAVMPAMIIANIATLLYRARHGRVRVR